MTRVSSMRTIRWCAAAAALLCSPVMAQTVGGAWVDVGPGPSHGGQIEGITNREVVGAVNALAPHPSNADILYIGTVNGGVWGTVNATAASPTWTRLSDSLGSLSIAALELDPTDGTRQTLVAGVARTSSLSSFGGEQIGVLRSTNAGAGWTVLTGGGTLSNRAVVGVAGRGSTLVVATDLGIYRSTNTGGAFTQISGGAGTGLPAGNTSDLAGDSSNNARLYTAVIGGSARGIYRSVDTGATWTKVSDATMDALMTSGSGSPRTEIAVGPSSQVFVAIVGQSGSLAGVFRSADGSGSFVDLGVPTTAEQNGVIFGIHSGGQGGLHLSIAADPTNSNIVYVGGDRQPYFGEGVPGSQLFFPNSLGALDYSGRLFRGDAALPLATRWTALTHSGTANNSAPHADSRDMAFDFAGNLLECDDGGVYKRLSPRLTTGTWVSVNGSLQSTEYHSIAYDTVANRVIGGGQDTGTTEQRDSATKIFDSVSTGDGNAVAVEDRSSATTSTRYSAFQFLQVLRRRTFNTANALTSTAFPTLTPLAGSPALDAQFYTPLATNAASGTRIVIGANNGVYESLDRGDTLTRISTQRVNAFRGGPLVYGVPGNPELVYFGAGTGLHLRTAAGGAINAIATLAGTVLDVAIDPDTPARLFALTSTTVQFSGTGGSPFNAVTGNLITGFAPGSLRSLAFVPGSDDALVVGSDRGTFVSFASGGFSTWSRLGTGLPNAPVMELDYDSVDQTLVAGTLGRGAWRLSPVIPSNTLFANGFE